MEGPVNTDSVLGDGLVAVAVVLLDELVDVVVTRGEAEASARRLQVGGVKNKIEIEKTACALYILPVSQR